MESTNTTETNPSILYVKDIRKFREFYKTNIKRTLDPDRNPHFVGEEIKFEEKTQFGLWEMFNGQGSIENKLTTILNIAGDSQAIYEFMQNAVDADSKNFFLAKYDSDSTPYLIVLNDGRYFTLESIISILSIGASSKYRNPDNIGQFGVGFKLAHRLIGADNSLKELLEENKGPILFSWSNNELAQLANKGIVKTINPECFGVGKDAVSNSNAPWLFKIVATNFPCLTNDKVLDAKGRPHDALFTNEDMEVLLGAARQCLNQCKEANSFQSGTLLVIPLHPAKVDHVIGKVPKGLEVAATIISRRAKKDHDLRTQIEMQELIPELLKADSWELSEEECIGMLGNEQVKIAELMFLYANPFETNPFKGKPQFYRYFPMSLEQHGFHFAIHSNALTLSSARTELQENDSNKFLFSKLVPLLEAELKACALNDTEKFTQIYASILLSNRGENSGKNWMQGRQWLEESLWLPLIQILRNNIPIKFENSFKLKSGANNVFVKDSNLPIELWYNEGQCQWFYWEEKQNEQLCFDAKLEDKLGLKAISLVDVLIKADYIDNINLWLSKSPDHALQFLKELDTCNIESNNETALWKNFSSLNLWWFDEKVFSIETLAKEETLKFNLINYGPLNDISDKIKKANIHVSTHHIDQFKNIFQEIRERHQKVISYLRNYEDLTRLLSIRFIQNPQFTVNDKSIIFKSIESAIVEAKRRVEAIKALALFTNNRGEVKALSELTAISHLPQMLLGWQIRNEEAANLKLDDYLANSKEEIYEFITKPFWNDIACQANQNEGERKALFAYIKECYTLKPTVGSLIPSTVFFTEVGQQEISFYHQLLSEFSENDYRLLSQVLSKIEIYLPQRSLLPFYKEAPFLLSPATSINLTKLTDAVKTDEAKALIRLLSKLFPETVKEQIYVDINNDFISIRPRQHGVYNYFSDKQEIHAFISTHFSDILLPFPKGLQHLLGESVLQGERLLEKLIRKQEEHKLPQAVNGLLLLILNNGNDEIKQKALSIIPKVNITEDIERNSTEYLSLQICLSINSEQARRESLGIYTFIKQDNLISPLGKVQNKGIDTLIIEHAIKGKLSFSVNKLLGGNANSINQVLTVALEKWVSLDLGTREKIAFAMGIHESRNPDDVYAGMVQSFKDDRINNGEQLIFIWALGKENPSFQIETLDGWRPLKGAFYMHPDAFLPNENIVGNSYSDITTIIKIENDSLTGSGWTLQSQPYLAGGILIMPGIKEIIEKEHPQFCKFLFEQWESSGCPSNIILKEEQYWNKIIGFQPTDFILSEKYSLEEEVVPVTLLAHFGLSIPKVNEFMEALGVQGERSAVIKSRKFFLKDGGDIDTSMTLSQTIATLKWLFTKEITVKRDDVATFYRALASKNIDLNYFPAIYPYNEGLKIVSLTDGVFGLNKDETNKALDQGIKITDIIDAANSPVINFANYEDWSSYLSQRTKLLDIKWNEIDWNKVNEEAQEWKFPFYLEWKNHYPSFVVNRLHGEMPRMILVNGNVVKCFRTGKAFLSQDTVFVSTADTEILLNEIDNLNAFNSEARVYLKQCYLAQSQQFESFIEIARNDPGFAQLLKEHAEAIKLQEERTERAEIVKNADVKYTLTWFLNLLELVRVQEQSANIPEVTFGKCERIPTAEKTYELSEVIGRIPTNIETFDDIPTIITYLNANNDPITSNTKLIASEKHKKLWVTFPEVSVQPILDSPERIISIKLVFTRTVDLIGELKNGFRRLGLAEDVNLKETLSDNIDFIFGPPGTGKTTELAKQIIAKSSDPKMGPIVILTPTNKAADVLAKKVIELNRNVAPDWLARAGSCTDPLLLQENVVKTGYDLLVEPDSNIVIITTIHRFPYFLIPINRHNNDRLRLCDCPWQEVIFDEASMIPLAYIVHAIQVRQRANPLTYFKVAGDPLQIPPVFDLLTEDLDDFVEELQEENIYSMIGLVSFDTDVQKSIPKYGNRIHNLEVQHRSVSVIGELFSKFQYEHRISHSRGTPNNSKPEFSRPLPERFASLGFKPITVIRYPVKSGDSIYKPQKLEGSPIHIYSSLLVGELIKSFRNEVRYKNDEPWSIGVLAPYRSQADLLMKIIEAQTYRGLETSITTDTVHGFQGDENNIVFAVFNPSGAGGNISCSRFLKKAFILNVAISRAEDYLIMLIPDEDSKGINGLSLINELVKLAEETAPEYLSVIHSTDLEELLMGKRNFFEMKSFATAHQKVNVYGKPDLPYIIRINEKSIDIHWEI